MWLWSPCMRTIFGIMNTTWLIFRKGSKEKKVKLMTFAITRLDRLSWTRPCILSEVIDRVSGRGEWVLLSGWHRATMYPVRIHYELNILRQRGKRRTTLCWRQKCIDYEWHKMKNIGKSNLASTICQLTLWLMRNFHQYLEKFKTTIRWLNTWHNKEPSTICFSRRNRENLIEYRSTSIYAVNPIAQRIPICCRIKATL